MGARSPLPFTKNLLGRNNIYMVSRSFYKAISHPVSNLFFFLKILSIYF